MGAMLGRSLIALGFFLLAHPLRAQPSYITFPSDIDWVTRESPYFRILYRRGEDRLAERSLLAAEKARRILSPVFEDLPDMTWIVLADFHDSLNGYAIDFPFPHMVIFASPPEPTGQLASLDGWLDSVILHEFVHVAHLYPAKGLWALMRGVFGAWVLPNGLMPSHVHEGMATFFETHHSRGGRGRGNTFSMYTRMAVKEGLWGNEFVPIDLMEGSSRWPMGASPYFFGYYLVDELWRRKQTQGIRDFVTKTSDGLPYRLSHAIESIYGPEYSDLWQGIFERTRKNAQSEIQHIESQPLSQLKWLSENRYQKWDLVASADASALAYRHSHPDLGSHITVQSTQEPEKKHRLETEPGSAQGLCWTRYQGSQWLVFTETVVEHGYVLTGLRAQSPNGSGPRLTIRSGNTPIRRIHALACGGDGRFLTYQEQSGRGTVTEWTTGKALDDWLRVRTWQVPEDTWVSSLVVAPSHLIALRKGMSTALYLWGASAEPRHVWDLSGHFFGFQPRLPTGEWPTVGSVSGRDEVWALDLDRKWARKLVAVLGGVNAYAYARNLAWVSAYRHGGYDIAEAQPIQHTASRLDPAPAADAQRGPAAIDTGGFSSVQNYSAWDSLRPRAWMPSMLIVPDGLQISAWIPGFDVSQKHVYNLFGGYDTRGSPFAVASYAYRFGRDHQLNAEADFFPAYLIRSRDFLKQWGGSLGWSTSLGPLLPRVSLAARFKRVEESRLGPTNQSVGFTAGISHLFGLRTAPRAIAPLRATQMSLNHSQYFQALGSDDNYFATVASVDQYLGIPWTPHVLKLSGRLGYTEGTAFYNSFFQGGGELMFSPGRGFFLNRGFLPGLFGSQRIFTFNMDYLFPLVQIERGWAEWPLFLKRLDGALIFDTTTVGQFQNFYSSVGAELKSQWKLFFYLPAVIRVGIYHGFGEFGEPVYATMAVEASL